MKKTINVKLKKGDIVKELKQEYPALETLVDEVIKEYKVLTKTYAICNFYRIYHTEYGIYLQRWGKEAHFRGYFLTKKLENANITYLFAITINKKLEKAITNAFETNDNQKGKVLDTIGAVMVKDSIKLLQNSIEKKEKSKMAIYRPGLDGWELKEQKKLFQLLDPKKIGLELKDDYSMSPKNSVSGLIVKDNGLSDSC